MSENLKNRHYNVVSLTVTYSTSILVDQGIMEDTSLDEIEFVFQQLTPEGELRERAINDLNSNFGFSSGLPDVVEIDEALITQRMAEIEKLDEGSKKALDEWINEADEFIFKPPKPFLID